MVDELINKVNTAVSIHLLDYFKMGVAAGRNAQARFANSVRKFPVFVPTNSEGDNLRKC